jgi:hypothetical protein
MASPLVRLLLLLLLLVAAASRGAASAAKAARVTAVIVFGDSTVDTGNNNQIGTPLRSDFPPYGRDMPGGARATGRFGNGRLAPDFMSESLGLPPLVPAYLDPAYGIADFARGVCFASAGTGLDNATAGVLVIIKAKLHHHHHYQQSSAKYLQNSHAHQILYEILPKNQMRADLPPSVSYIASHFDFFKLSQTSLKFDQFYRKIDNIYSIKLVLLNLRLDIFDSLNVKSITIFFNKFDQSWT